MKPLTSKPETEMGKKFDKDLQKTKAHLEEMDRFLTEKKQSLKRKIFSLDKMEALVHGDPKLSAVYEEMSEDGREKYGYHYNETIMNIIFNEYVLQSPKYLQKYKMAQPKKKKRRDKSGIEQLKKAARPKEKTDETQEMGSFSRYGKGPGTIDSNEEMGETVKTGDMRSTKKEGKKSQKFTGGEFKGDSIAKKPTNEEEIDETTSAGTSGGGNGSPTPSYQYSGPAMWSKSGEPMMRKPIWQGGTVIAESNYLTEIESFKEYFNFINESEGFEKTLDLIKEAHDKNADSRELDRVLNKFEALMQKEKPSPEEKEAFFKIYNEFLKPFVAKNIEHVPNKALSEKNKNMNEHHLNSKEEKIDFIVKNMTVKNIQKSLEKMSEDEVDRLYNVLEKKMGLVKETEASVVDQPKPDSMSFTKDPLTNTGQDMEMGTTSMNEHHLETRDDKIDYICKAYSQFIYKDKNVNMDNLKHHLAKKNDDEIHSIYLKTEEKLKDRGIDPTSLDEKAESKSQQKFMGMVKGVQDGEIDPEDVGEKVKRTAKQMDPKDVEDFASTKHDNLPDKVDEVEEPDMDFSDIDDLLEQTDKILDEISFYRKSGMNEEKKTPSMVSGDRLRKDNQKNFKSDLKGSGTKEAIEAQKDLQHKDQQTEIDDPKKFSEDIEKEVLKQTKGEALKNVGDSVREGDKIPKRNHTTEEQKEVDLTRKGMQDWQYDNKPSDRFEQRMKDGMGEEFYKQRQEKMKKQAKAPTYNKDTQPVFDGEEKNQYDKNLSEAVVTGLYFDDLYKRRFVNFSLNEAIHTNKPKDEWFKLQLDGLGNSYTNVVELNEGVVKNIDECQFYLNDENDKIYFTRKKSTINEGEDKTMKIDEGKMNKMKHLLDYNPKSFTETKSTKKNRGF